MRLLRNKGTICCQGHEGISVAQLIMEVVTVLNHETTAKLRQMKLAGMVEAYEQQRSVTSAHALSFDERLGLMVDQEWIRRQNNKMGILMKKAGFIQSWPILGTVYPVTI